jgi:hypothetical protein
MDGWKKAVTNAGIMAGLAAIPIWIAYESIDYTMAKAVVGTFVVTFLTLCARYFRPPKTDINGESECIGPEKKESKILGMLWV